MAFKTRQELKRQRAKQPLPMPRVRGFVTIEDLKRKVKAIRYIPDPLAAAAAERQRADERRLQQHRVMKRVIRRRT